MSAVGTLEQQAQIDALTTALRELRQQVEDSIAAGQTDSDAEGWITAYHFRTGAIHRLLAKARDPLDFPIGQVFQTIPPREEKTIWRGDPKDLGASPEADVLRQLVDALGRAKMQVRADHDSRPTRSSTATLSIVDAALRAAGRLP